ncbi:hypothetical protein EVG20_g6595 [Dentipellis fragilis]|uniref:Uncharacterized protein n=1 Tax=Dentipellis fragilis TaxID=205917 RepID=A0A4Y9YLA5_9AGAM|nr:hypothetical protein EVG20_g6595 [Dentipellis fragilis]
MGNPDPGHAAAAPRGPRGSLACSPSATMSTTVLVSSFPPFPTFALSVDTESTLDDVYDALLAQHPTLPASADLRLTPVSGRLPEPDAPLSSIYEEHDDTTLALISLRLAPRMRGGKGGFGSQLRAAGGRMSSQKTSNNDSCRDLSGRRLSTIKEAKKVLTGDFDCRLAEYLETEPARKKAAAEAQRAKLKALERKLGIDKNAGPSGSGGARAPRRARSIGLLKKKKKAKTGHSPSGSTPPKDAAPAAKAKTASVTVSALTEAAEAAAASSAAPAAPAPTAVGGLLSFVMYVNFPIVVRCVIYQTSAVLAYWQVPSFPVFGLLEDPDSRHRFRVMVEMGSQSHAPSPAGYRYLQCILESPHGPSINAFIWIWIWVWHVFSLDSDTLASFSEVSGILDSQLLHSAPTTDPHGCFPDFPAVLFLVQWVSGFAALSIDNDNAAGSRSAAALETASAHV